MIKVDNSSFLSFLESEDIIRNFYTCDNIVNCGKEGYAIRNISFFTADGKPSDSYISFCENVFDELIVEIKTDNSDLIYSALCEIKKVSKKYKKVRIGSNSQEFFESKLFKKFLKIEKSYFAEYGVFAQISAESVPTVSIPDNISIELVAEDEKQQFIDYDDGAWDGLSSLVKYGNDTDKLFILRSGDTVCGYLMANNSYKNIYDIANVFVFDTYRGKGFGKLLTVAFSKYCYGNGFIPHYGTAISKYSENVAMNSGFVEMYRQHYADVKVKRLIIG